ncbi:MAG: UDP-N-acetylmuramoyl-tripeptide--D-alanyl-D-alanine ligase [Bacilli bacterium]|nr:UDP-N-acetylmuramoyl-tripeptide--D-alanyl-D-alanine ligase [Bacilli bacterium]
MYIFICIYLIYIFYKSRTSLYMLQQNLYNENDRYIRWIKRNFNRCFNLIDFIPFILSIFIFLTKESFVMELVYWIISIVYIKAIYDEYEKNLNNQNKIKFNVTNRIKRLYFTEFIIVGLLIVLLIMFNFSGIFLILLSLLVAFLYHYIYIINIINKPIERLVYLYYFNKAKKKLDNMNRLSVIGVTGSYGKTSSKNILSHILEAKYITRPTPKNLNTPYGLMITINNYLDKFDEILVAEMGAYVGGEIKNMCDFVKPKYGILTIIGDAHLETFKTKENICKAKFELIENLNPEGACVLNRDDPYQVNYVQNELQNKVKIIWIGIDNPEADFSATSISSGSHGTKFDFSYLGKTYHVETKLLGIHNVYNILASIALGVELKVPLDGMINKIVSLQPTEHRLEIKKLNNITMIDDAYNSNPVGAKNALEVLSMMDGIKVVVTPGMIELGKKEKKLNTEFGRQISHVADYVILVGREKTKYIKEGILENFDKRKLIVINNVVDAYRILEDIKFDNKDKEIFALFENDLPDIYSEGEKK